ncbi:MAG: TraR/DksA C4-type zinc finger protein [Chloroflexi bacterium]|nr:TraR/DksA C4-type zinc finger protein [Chloroflexota bacterium]
MGVDGTYGRCGSCGEPISPRQLRALPFAVLCIQCQSEADRQTAGGPKRRTA